MSIIATVLLSLLSSLIGLGNYWTLLLPKRNPVDPKGMQDTKGTTDCNIAVAEQGDQPKKVEDHAPSGDIVIRYPKGSFLVVRCHEDVARELYFAPEEINYLVEDAWIYRLLSLVGTMMLMGGVICLANAKIESQIAWAGSYMLLGSAYWIVAALPQKVHWDTSCYTVTSEALSDSVPHIKKNFFSHSTKYPYSKGKNFTEALWKAIVASKDATWVRREDHCPNTAVWDEWLLEAKNCSREYMEPMTEADFKEAKMTYNGTKTWQIPKWDSGEHLRYLLREAKKPKERAGMVGQNQVLQDSNNGQQQNAQQSLQHNTQHDTRS